MWPSFLMVKLRHLKSSFKITSQSFEFMCLGLFVCFKSLINVFQHKFQSINDYSELVKACHISCNSFLRKEGSICFQNLKWNSNSNRRCAGTNCPSSIPRLYTLRLRMCSSIRNTTRKKTVKLTLNMGIPILFYSKDKHQNKEANTFSL